MLWFTPKRPRNIDAAIRKIEEASIVFEPFPHLVIYDALPKADFKILQKQWPGRSAMRHEPEHDRYYGSIAGQDQLARDWSDIRATVLTPVIDALGRRLQPFYARRFANTKPEFKQTVLTLHEAGEEFVEHRPHNHFVHNPEYAFTMLLAIEDNGSTARGTSLYGYENLPDQYCTRDDDALMSMSSGLLHFYLTKRTDVPFVPNRILAFLDGPFAIHGSTPFEVGKETGIRKMIVAHTAGTGAYLEQSRSVATMDTNYFIQCAKDYRANKTIPSYMRELLELERGVMASWQAPSTGS